MNMEIRDVGPDITKLTEGGTPAADIDLDWECYGGHGETPLHQLSNAQLVEEWNTLFRWDGEVHHPTYDDSKSTCSDPGLCRCIRLWAIEGELTRRPATCVEDVLWQFAILEQVASGKATASPPVAVTNFEWGDRDDTWSARAYFDSNTAPDMLRRVLQNLHELTKGRI
jgi:hypothetical protein